MNQLLLDLWPFIIPALFAIIGWQWKESHTTKTRVAVLEKAIDDLLKTIESMQKRQDSHSQKQDEILEKMNSMEHELLKQIGTMGVNIGSLASDVKNLSNLLSITDMGIKITK